MMRKQGWCSGRVVISGLISGLVGHTSVRSDHRFEDNYIISPVFTTNTWKFKATNSILVVDVKS